MTLFAAFAADLRSRRLAAGLTQEQLAARLHYASGRTVISKAENEKELPSEKFVAAVDEALAAGGALVGRLREVHAAELRAQADALSGNHGAAVVDVADGSRALLEWEAPSAEEDTTDRRQLLSGGALFATGAAASALSERIAVANPTPLTLREIGVDLQQIAESYNHTPRISLVPHIESGWLRVQRMLDSRVSMSARVELNKYAGWYSYYLATLAFDLGHHAVAHAHLLVAAHHAEETKDRLLAGSVASLDWALAHFTGDYSRGIAIAAAARVDADPYIIPTLAGNEASSCAAARRPGQARAALDDMWNHVLVDVVPGPLTIDDAEAHAISASVFVSLNDGASAESHARRSLNLLIGTGQFGEIGGSYRALARSFLRRRNPDPEQAAQAARDGVRALEGRPVWWVIQPTAAMWSQMQGQWGSLPSVRELGRDLAHFRTNAA